MAVDLYKTGLPPPWTYGIIEDGRIFFINEELKSTTWLHPVHNHPIQAGNLSKKDLPRGWEMNYTPEGVPYFIDHTSLRTSFIHPVTGESELPVHEEANQQADITARQNKNFKRSSLRRSSKKTKIINKVPAPKRSEDAPVTLRGWLYKQDSGGLKSWKRRWFILSDFCLYYYKGPEESQTQGSILLPSYKIGFCHKDDGVNRKYSFKAEHQNMRTYYFAAENSDEQSRWMKALELATILKRDPSVEYVDSHSLKDSQWHQQGEPAELWKQDNRSHQQHLDDTAGFDDSRARNSTSDRLSIEDNSGFGEPRQRSSNIPDPHSREHSPQGGIENMYAQVQPRSLRNPPQGLGSDSQQMVRQSEHISIPGTRNTYISHEPSFPDPRPGVYTHHPQDRWGDTRNPDGNRNSVSSRGSYANQPERDVNYNVSKGYDSQRNSYSQRGSYAAQDTLEQSQDSIERTLDRSFDSTQPLPGYDSFRLQEGPPPVQLGHQEQNRLNDFHNQSGLAPLSRHSSAASVQKENSMLKLHEWTQNQMNKASEGHPQASNLRQSQSSLQHGSSQQSGIGQLQSSLHSSQQSLQRGTPQLKGAYNLQQGMNQSHSSIQPRMDQSHSSIQRGVVQSHSSIQRGMDQSHSSIQRGMDQSHSSIQLGMDQSHSSIQRDIDQSRDSIQRGMDQSHGSMQREMNQSQISKQPPFQSSVHQPNHFDPNHTNQHRPDGRFMQPSNPSASPADSQRSPPSGLNLRISAGSSEPSPERPPIPAAYREQYIRELAATKTPHTRSDLLDSIEIQRLRQSEPLVFRYPEDKLRYEQQQKDQQYGRAELFNGVMKGENQQTSLNRDIITSKSWDDLNNIGDDDDDDDDDIAEKFNVSSRITQLLAEKRRILGDQNDPFSTPDQSSNNSREHVVFNNPNPNHFDADIDGKRLLNQAFPPYEIPISRSDSSSYAVPSLHFVDKRPVSQNTAKRSLDLDFASKHDNIYENTDNFRRISQNILGLSRQDSTSSTQPYGSTQGLVAGNVGNRPKHWYSTQSDVDLYKPETKSHLPINSQSEHNIQSRTDSVVRDLSPRSDSVSHVSRSLGNLHVDVDAWRQDLPIARIPEQRVEPLLETAQWRHMLGKKAPEGSLSRQNVHYQKREIETIKEDPNMPDQDILTTKTLADLQRHLEGQRLRLSISANDLIGKSHEELILLLIQLRRDQSKLERIREYYRSKLDYHRPNEKHYKIKRKNSIGRLQDAQEQEHVEFIELRKMYDEIDQQVEVHKPLVNLLDNMVRMGSLYGGDNLMMASQYKQHRLHPDEYIPPKKMITFTRQYQEEKLSQLQEAELKQLMDDEVDLEEKLQQLYKLDRELQEKSLAVINLQQNKAELERSVTQVRKDVLNEEDPQQMKRLNQYLRSLESELAVVRLQLADSSKQLEQTSTEDGKVENEVMLLRKRIYGLNRTSSTPSLMNERARTRQKLELELQGVQNVMDGLSKQGAVLSDTIKSLRRSMPDLTGGSSKTDKSYLETDLDTDRSRDLSRDADLRSQQTNGSKYDSVRKDRSRSDSPPASHDRRPQNTENDQQRSYRTESWKHSYGMVGENQLYDNSKPIYAEIRRVVAPQEAIRNSQEIVRENWQQKTMESSRTNEDQGRGLHQRTDGLYRAEMRMVTPEPNVPNRFQGSRDNSFSDQEDSFRSGQQMYQEQIQPDYQPIQLSEADENTKKFFGLLSKDAARLQTVREVKKEAERRSRERKRFYVNVHGPADLEEAGSFQRSQSLPRKALAPVFSSSTTLDDTSLIKRKSVGVFKPNTEVKSDRRVSAADRLFTNKAQTNTKPPESTQPISNIFTPRPFTGSAPWQKTNGQQTANHQARATNIAAVRPVVNKQETLPSVTRKLDDVRSYSSDNLIHVPSQPRDHEYWDDRAKERLVPRGRFMTVSSAHVSRETVPHKWTPDKHSNAAGDLISGSWNDNTPDYIQSEQVKDIEIDSETIERHVLFVPEKVDIPERYVPDSDEEETEEHRERRLAKGQQIKRMIASQSLAEFRQAEVGMKTYSGPVHQHVEAERRRREHLLDLKHALAIEVTQRSNQVAALAESTKPEKPARVEESRINAVSRPVSLIPRSLVPQPYRPYQSRPPIKTFSATPPFSSHGNTSYSTSTPVSYQQEADSTPNTYTSSSRIGPLSPTPPQNQPIIDRRIRTLSQ